MKIEIKTMWDSLLFEYEKDKNTLKDTLIHAVKTGANLCGADLYGANLCGANEEEKAKIDPLHLAQTIILPEGDIIGYKKCKNGIIVKLLISKDAKRSNSTGRKCRAEFADVVEIYGANVAVSSWDEKFTYKVGKRVKPKEPFNEDRFNECASGIHFYITKIEAENN